MKMRPSLPISKPITAENATASAKKPRAASAAPGSGLVDELDAARWRAFRGVLLEALECVLDSAVIASADVPEDVRALEHFREVMQQRLTMSSKSTPLPMRTPELLHALAILLGSLTMPGISSESDMLATASHRLRHIACADQPPRRADGRATSHVRFAA
jgi:hypothetical protein